MAAKLVERRRRRAARVGRRAPRAGRACARRCSRAHPPGSRTAPGSGASGVTARILVERDRLRSPLRERPAGSRSSSSKTIRRFGCCAGSTSSSRTSGSRRRRRSTRPARRWRRRGRRSSSWTCTSVRFRATTCSTSCCAARIPVVLVSGTTDLDRYAGRADEVLDEAVRARRSDCRRATPCGRLRSREHDAPSPSARRPSSRPASRATSTSARRRRAPCGWARRRSRSRREIVARYADLFSREQLDALREAEDGADRRRARAALPAAQDLRGRPRRRRARRARGRAREPRCSPRASPSSGEELPLRSAQAQLAVLAAYADREELGEIQADASAALQPRPARADRGGGGALRRALRRSPAPVERNEEEKGISLRELSGVAAARRAADSVGAFDGRSAAHWFERLLGPERDGDPVELPHLVHAPALAARVDLHEGARDRGLPRDADGARLRPRRRDEHQARPRRPAAEGAARLRDRERPAAASCT